MAKNRGRHNSRYFEFEDAKEVINFVVLYSDLFVPYSENSDIYKYGNDTVKKTAKQGWVFNGKLLQCNLTPESLEDIMSSGSFEKVKVRKNIYKYVMRKAA